jgi:integral membrane protein
VSSVQHRPAPRGGAAARRRDPGGSLPRYRVMAVVTGVMLLLLTLSVVLKYLAGVDTGSLGAGIAIAHGWIYVVYLVTVADLWSKLRWPFGRLVVLVLCGVVPLLSFWAERRVVAEVRAGRSGPDVPAAPGSAR